MSANSSSWNDDSPPSNIDVYCFLERQQPNFLAINAIRIVVLLPLCIFIIHHGLREKLQKHSTSSTATMSHSDFFTFHLALMELFGCLGCVLNLCTAFSERPIPLFLGGFSLLTFVFVGEMFCHTLTCVEHYLAVVYPVTYLNLKKERAIKIRKIVIVCIWLLVGTMTGLIEGNEYVSFSVKIILTGTDLGIVSFCSLSVLCSLIHSGPGKQGERKKGIDQSKKRAFYTIVTILAILIIRFVWDLIWTVLYVSGQRENCSLMSCKLWINLPSSLVLPLLFLQRAGFSTYCRKVTFSAVALIFSGQNKGKE